MLKIENVSFSYDTDPVLRGVSLTIDKPSITALLGPSGCGKSTLLRLVARLETQPSGEIHTLANTIGFVFQEPSLMPWATVAENVALPLKLVASGSDTPIREALNRVGMADFINRYPHQLSGGQKMRVSIARALVSKPDILLLDEPFAALDEMLRFQLNDMLLEIKAELDIPILFVTHSIYEACYLADTICVMQSGMIAHQIAPALKRGESGELRTSPEFLTAVQSVSKLLAGAKV